MQGHGVMHQAPWSRTRYSPSMAFVGQSYGDYLTRTQPASLLLTLCTVFSKASSPTTSATSLV